MGQVDAIVQQFCAAKLGTDRCDGEEATMTVVVAHQDYNWHAYARFLYVGELRKHIPIDSVIFIDDDQLWLDEFILSMVQSYAPKSSSHWYGKLYLKSKTKVSFAVYGNKFLHLMRYVHSLARLPRGVRNFSRSLSIIGRRV